MLNPLDFFNVTGAQPVVGLVDILDVIQSFGAQDDDVDGDTVPDHPLYMIARDVAGGDPKGPNGVIDLEDILAVIFEFGFNCT